MKILYIKIEFSTYYSFGPKCVGLNTNFCICRLLGLDWWPKIFMKKQVPYGTMNSSTLESINK